MQNNTVPKKLFKKLLNITKAIGTVKKSGLNKFQNYQYVTLADLLEVIKPLLIKNDIMITTSVVDVQKENEIAIVKLEHTICDVESGEIHTAVSTRSDHLTAGNTPEQNPNLLPPIPADIDSNNQSTANGPKRGGDTFGATL